MIDKELIRKILDNELNKRDLYLIDLTISKNNKINVYVDSFNGVTIEECVEISRAIESQLNRDEEDYDLEVSSPGLNKPFKLPFQYKKNIGRVIEVITTSGEKLKGKLINAGDTKIDVEVSNGKNTKNKKEKMATVFSFDYSIIKSARVTITF